MELRLPERGRPRVAYKKCELGVDLPAQFVYDLKALDENLWPVYHPYKLIWDNFANADTGSLADPRYATFEQSTKVGTLVLGHVLTDGDGQPLPDGTWHVWRWCEPAASWAHVINIDSKDPLYLNLLMRRLWLTDQYNQRYGHRGYQKMLEQADAKTRQKAADDRKDLMGEIHKANAGMVNRVIENFKRGVYKKDPPKKEIIMSGEGISNRSKIVRPVTDREGGLILPPGFGEE
jgi:hypothetical protein